MDDFQYNIKEIEDWANSIISGWNGKDDKFQVGGIIFTEEHVDYAEDIAYHAHELISLLNNMNQ